MNETFNEAQLEQEMAVKLRVTNDFMFNRVMRQPEICKEFLEDVLPEIRIKRLEYLETQKSIESHVDARGIRLDVYSEDEDKVYNIELQRANLRDLPRRTRFYQGQIDVNLLEKGTDYEDLKDCYIIFVCTFDPFGKGQYRYTFENRCLEENLKLDDGTWKVFLNSKGTKGKIHPDLKILLDYFENREIPQPTKLIEKIESAVEEANQDKEWRRQVMIENLKYRDERKLGKMEGLQEGLQLGRQEGLQEGRQEGLQQGVEKTAIKLLKMNHPIPFIQEATELSEKEILTLKNKLNKEE